MVGTRAEGSREAGLGTLAGTAALRPALLLDFQRLGGTQAGSGGSLWACWGKPRVLAQGWRGSWHVLCLGAPARPLMKSLCQGPGPTHCRLKKDRDASLPN